MFYIRDKWVKDNEVVEVGEAYRNFNAYSHKSSLRRPSIRLTEHCFAPRIGWILVEALLRSSVAQCSHQTAKPDSCREEMVISFSIRMMTKWCGNDFRRQLEVSRRMSKQTYSKEYN
ncbi:hypothetical protein E1A91_A01G106000v1 [Gossypium mustelinum]|uniref:Uncharacterized protein n=1 Tax=Gossypium mustelinum TaxID=34275 RepID=A0A5D3ADU9_GOSMU|nr:hypothetical protein E1A91_A01G106000v1 [Gossypium mustelinum]